MDDKRLLESITKTAAEEAAKVAIDIYKKEQNKLNKTIEKRIKHNTVKLLKNYNRLKVYVEHAITDADKIENSWLAKFLQDLLEADEKVIAKSIAESKEQTEIMMKHLDHMLEEYEVLCNTQPVNYCVYMKRYYIARESLTDIANSINVDERTAHRYISRGIDEFSVLMWGIVGIKDLINAS